MATESQICDFAFPGKEFILPNISGLWLLEEFVVYPDFSDQIALDTYPTAILDDSCVYEVMRSPSIPLVESVEAFILGLIDIPFGHSSVKPNADVPMVKRENHELLPVTVENAECDGVFVGSSYNQTVQSDANASAPDLQISSNNPQPSSVNGLQRVKVESAECHGFFADSSHNWIVQSDADASAADSQPPAALPSSIK